MNKLAVQMRCTLIMVLMLSAGPIAVHADSMQTTADLIATFLMTGRNIVAEALKEYKINDTSIGDKGFTPDIFEASINDTFKRQTGVDILADDAGSSGASAKDLEYLKILLDASKTVCENNQALINLPGIGFKGFIPATYGKATGEIFQNKTDIRLKQTSIKFRNSYNVPDEMERKILEKMAKAEYPKDKAWVSDDGDTFRLMKPLYITKACLPCHGGPKGELDVAGRKKEGYKLGELRGAISVFMKK